jgi:hypothetical protein
VSVVDTPGNVLNTITNSALVYDTDITNYGVWHTSSPYATPYPYSVYTFSGLTVVGGKTLWMKPNTDTTGALSLELSCDAGATYPFSEAGNYGIVIPLGVVLNNCKARFTTWSNLGASDTRLYDLYIQ